jgi:LytS/YehU family sensor histidine kinase
MSDDRRLLQSLAGTLGVLLENVRYRTQRREQEDREERLLWLASRAELKALRAQINPHFLFNALNAIAGLIHVQPQLADETIERLAMVFRYILRASEAEWVRLGEEMDFVASYLQVEHARFGPRLSFRFDIHPDAAAVRIPAMTVQPLIENAIKHGASMAEGGGRVGLRAWLLHQELRVEVSDNGPGFPPGFALDDIGEGHIPGGHGLRNVLERLRGYYGGGAGLSWENGSDGTKVTLAIPAERASAPHGDDVSYARSDRG